MDKIKEFARIFDVPPALMPYIDSVASEAERELVIALGDQSLTVAEIAERLQKPAGETADFLDQSFRRCIVKRSDDDGELRYQAETFYRRIDPLSMYEKWGDIPPEARQAAHEWEMETFLEMHQEAIRQMKEDPDAVVRVPNRDVLTLKEALQQVEEADQFVIAPCDCRAIAMNCDYPAEACVRLNSVAQFSLDRGMGREVTKAEMKNIVISVHRAGLMQTGHRDLGSMSKEWGGDGKAVGFCNCCPCCCYPMSAGEQLGLHRNWPRAHHVAERDLSRCTHCGRCVGRCHFDAFFSDGSTVQVGRHSMIEIKFAPDRCIGCSLCETTCPERAITMRPLTPEEDAEIEVLRKANQQHVL